MLIAISQTSDPLGNWDSYSFPMNQMPDYMKFGIWEDAYYMATNTSGGSNVYAFEKAAMMAGANSPKYVGFNNPNKPGTIDGFNCILPLDCDWDYAPANTPGLFITMTDDAWNGTDDELWIYECKVNWTTPTTSTFARTERIIVEDFDSNFEGGWENIVQKGTTQKIDGIPQVLMYRAQYINFGDYQTIVICHTVDVDDTDHAGIRWYELRKNIGSWEVRQQGTYAPDANSRWIGGISMNKYGEIALGYSISSSSMYPSIRLTGQSAYENYKATGILDIAEISLQAGTNSQTASERWGDYSGMCVDPVNNKHFWYTNQYGGVAMTKITCVDFIDLNIPANLVATAKAKDLITLDWLLGADEAPIVLAYSETGEFGTPKNGTTYTEGQEIEGGGKIIYIGANKTFDHIGLTPATLYYYRAWTVIDNVFYTSYIESEATTLETGLPTINYEKAIAIYPNPSNGIFTLQFDCEAKTRMLIDIYTADNKLIYSAGLKNVSNGEQKTIDLTRHAKGTYIMKVNIKGQIVTYNLVIN